MDIEELNSHFQQSGDRSLTEVERADAQRRFVKLAIKNFPAIVAKLEALERGEFICKSCGHRKDADASKIDPPF